MSTKILSESEKEEIDLIYKNAQEVRLESLVIFLQHNLSLQCSWGCPQKGRRQQCAEGQEKGLGCAPSDPKDSTVKKTAQWVRQAGIRAHSA